MKGCVAALLCLSAVLIAGCSSDSSGPDGDNEPTGTIVFSSDRDGDYDIYSMNADGGGVLRLTTNSVFDG